MLATIIIRTYNNERHISRAVESAVTQDIPNEKFEVVVIDDGSTDTTLSILKNYSGRLTIQKEEHTGTVSAANIGLHAARGEYVSFLDADDEYSTKFLRKMTAAAEQNNADFVYCDYREVFEEDDRRFVSCANNLFNTVFGNLLFNRKSMTEAGFLNENLIFPEYDLLLKTLGVWKGVHVPEPLFSYYRHTGSITASLAKVEKGMEQLRALHPDKLDAINKIRTY